MNSFSLHYASVCSGIESAHIALSPLGFTADWFSEINPFCCALLKQHFPHIPNHGDLYSLSKKIKNSEITTPDLLCAGTPCQSFSTLGLRKGLNDTRGNLSLELVHLLNAIDNSTSENIQEFNIPKKSYADYLSGANGDALLASKAYFNKELIGKYVNAIIGKVWLLGSSRGKMIYGRGKRSIEIKSKIIPFVPEILKQGKYEGRDELYKQRNDAYVAFHAFTKEITTDGCIFNVRIYVGERENDRYEFVAYDMKATKEKENPIIQQNLDSVKWNSLRFSSVQTITPDAVQRSQERTIYAPSVSPCVIRQEPQEHLTNLSVDERKFNLKSSIKSTLNLKWDGIFVSSKS